MAVEVVINQGWDQPQQVSEIIWRGYSLEVREGNNAPLLYVWDEDRDEAADEGGTVLAIYRDWNRARVLSEEEEREARTGLPTPDTRPRLRLSTEESTTLGSPYSIQQILDDADGNPVS